MWLRSHPNPPVLEHLSFRVGNQLFFVHVVDIDRKVHGPGTIHGLKSVADGNNGHACILLMKKDLIGNWAAVGGNEGLFDIDSQEPIDPFSLITEEKIEMSSWEIHDMGVQVVRDYIQKQGFELMSWQSNPQVDPAIWFVGESKGPEYIVVRAAHHERPERPENWNDISMGCSRMSKIGHFASVGLISARNLPLWRGGGMMISFHGLE